MIYKGHDLDLRTSRGDDQEPWSARVVDQKSSVYKRVFHAPSSADKAIWVDETVMRLCNQAHDLAASMGASEVDVAHLACAMTQIEAAAAELVELNMNVSKLRLGLSPLLVNSDVEASWDGKSSPKKSEAFEEVLNAAAERARDRRTSISMADIVGALFDMSRDNPTQKLLTRLRNDFALRSDAGVEDEELRVRTGRRRVRVSAKSNQIGDADRLLNGVPTVTDITDRMRMDAIERAIRALTESMGQNATLAVAPQPAPPPPQPPTNGTWTNGSYSDVDYQEMQQLVGRIERNVNAKFAELSRSWDALGERLEALESFLEDFDGDIRVAGGGLSPEIEARLKTLTFAHERLDTLHSLLTSVSERLSELDAAGGQVELKPVLTSLGDMEAGLRGIGGQLREVDSRTGDVNLTIEEMNSRQKHMLTMLEEQQEQINTLRNVVREEVGQITFGDDFDGARVQQMVENSLRNVTDSFDRQREAMSGLVNRAVAERFAAIQLPGRMARIEEYMKDAAERPLVVSENGSLNADAVNDTVSQILANQNDMSRVIDDWRGTSNSELAELRARIDRIDTRPVAPAPQMANEGLDDIREQLRRIQTGMEHPRPTDAWSRVKVWLFGTTDWYGASWDSREEDATWRAPQVNRESNESVDEAGVYKPGQPRSFADSFRA